MVKVNGDVELMKTMVVTVFLIFSSVAMIIEIIMYDFFLLRTDCGIDYSLFKKDMRQILNNFNEETYSTNKTDVSLELNENSTNFSNNYVQLICDSLRYKDGENVSYNSYVEYLKENNICEPISYVEYAYWISGFGFSMLLILHIYDLWQMVKNKFMFNRGFLYYLCILIFFGMFAVTVYYHITYYVYPNLICHMFKM